MHGHDRENRFMVGPDVGSTTVKAVVLDAATDEILGRTISAMKPSSPRRL